MVNTHCVCISQSYNFSLALQEGMKRREKGSFSQILGDLEYWAKALRPFSKPLVESLESLSTC